MLVVVPIQGLTGHVFAANSQYRSQGQITCPWPDEGGAMTLGQPYTQPFVERYSRTNANLATRVGLKLLDEFAMALSA